MRTDKIDIIDEVIKRYDDITEVEKANPYHDALGRFTTAGGGGGGAASTAGSGAAASVKELNSLPKYAGTRKVPYDDIKRYEDVLNKVPVGTKIKQETDAGTEYYSKVSDEYMGWEQTRAPWGDTIKRSAFDVGQWMAGTGYVSRSDFEIE